ncbi:transporter substrate-binding domain-containing protein [Aliidiomarina halalkaliphila]|uniref:Transporter substrate-binding domain-containing protein n=1 Tax=Aliidiomarina halalkaliphila TaxID=2593535 RepID=A0A552X401_9GAMM|nr:transporter substrate-binding domain-containing protein [Aliidiomarina halalkaliphila]TRW49751.1 transporter substrate-binding domain-containing protein [Aliidiomarina halalkaliphila]
MKLFKLSVLFGLALGMIACTEAPQSTVTDAQDQGTARSAASAKGQADLRVLYVAADGFAYTDENGELTGVTVEIMRDFVSWFERYHAVRVNLEFVEETNWQRFYQRIVDAQGGVFGLGNVTITEERRAELQFSPAYLNNVAVLVTHNGIAELTDWMDFPEVFADLEPMAFSGTLHEERIRGIRDRFQPGVDIHPAESNPEIIDAVSHDGMYSYIDAYNYWRAVEQGAPLRHHPIADEHGETFGIIMPHSNDWATLMVAFFAADGGYRNTPRYRQIMETHLGEALTETLENARAQDASGGL